MADARFLLDQLSSATVLWEEALHNNLAGIHHDATRRMALLKAEAARVAGNNALPEEEKVRFLRSIVFVAQKTFMWKLERLQCDLPVS